MHGLRALGPAPVKKPGNLEWQWGEGSCWSLKRIIPAILRLKTKSPMCRNSKKILLFLEAFPMNPVRGSTVSQCVRIPIASNRKGMRRKKARRSRKMTKRTVTKIPPHAILRMMMMTTSARERHAVTAALLAPVALVPPLGLFLGPASAGLGFYVQKSTKPTGQPILFTVRSAIF